jgi:5-methylcytosine-specific restriction endonuclease McrA
VITRAEIMARRTAKGGWTRATLAEFGVPWPPPRHFLRNLLSGRAEPVDFLETSEWKRLRYSILERDGFRCTICGRDSADGVKLQVDHLKPRSLYPELEKDPANLATKCADCNLGKGID